ncbi:MAG: hypothetical protein AAB759_00835 [Patescibacteria group bacterium]
MRKLLLLIMVMLAASVVIVEIHDFLKGERRVVQAVYSPGKFTREGIVLEIHRVPGTGVDRCIFERGEEFYGATTPRGSVAVGDTVTTEYWELFNYASKKRVTLGKDYPSIGGGGWDRFVTKVNGKPISDTPPQ